MYRIELTCLIVFVLILPTNGEQASPAVLAPPTSKSLQAVKPSKSDYRAKWAVVIGINNYEPKSGVVALHYCVNDASAMRAALHDDFGYQVKDFGDTEDHIGYLPNDTASLSKIKETLTKWLPGQGVQSDDSVIFFFSGHGIVDWNSESKESYIVPIDGELGKLKETCLSLSELRKLLAQLPCRHKMVVLDCCYSGNLFREQPKSEHTVTEMPDALGDPIAFYRTRPAFWGMSAALNTPASEGTGEELRSVFTAALLAELHDFADSPRANHVFTFRELAPRVVARVTNTSGQGQIPDWGRLDPEAGGDFVFVPVRTRLTPREQSARRQYAINVSSLPHVWESGEVALGRKLLDELNPSRATADLRNFEWRYWDTVCNHSQRLKLQPQFAKLPVLSYRHDGSRLATALDKSVRILNADNGLPLGEIAVASGNGQVTCLDYGPSGQQLAIAWTELAKDSNGQPEMIARLALVDDTANKITSEFASMPGFIRKIAFSHDSRRIAAMSCDLAGHGHLVIWDSQGTKLKVRDFAAGDAQLAFSPNSNEMAISYAGENGRTTLERWNLDSGDIKVIATNLLNQITSLAFSSDGMIADARTGMDSRKNMLGEINLWYSDTGEIHRTVRGHTDEITDLAFSSDGDQLVSSSRDRSLRVWDPQVGRELFVLRGHARPVGKVVFRPNLREIASVSESYQPALPRVASLQQSDIERVFGRTDEGVTECWIWKTEAPPGETGFEKYHDRPVTAVAFNVDGTRLASASLDRTLRIWDRESGAEAHTISLDLPAMDTQFSCNGKYLVACCGDPQNSVQPGEVIVWDAATFKKLRTITIDCGGAFDLDLSSDGEQVAVACWDKTRPASVQTTVPLLALGRQRIAANNAAGQVRGFQLSDGGQIFAIPQGTGITTVASSNSSLAWTTWGVKESPDKYLSLTSSRSICGTPVPKNGPKIQSRDEANAILSLAFSPNGKKVATASIDGTVTVENAHATEGPTFLRGHVGAVNDVAFSRDGERIATAGADKTVRVWDVATGYELANFYADVNQINVVAFSPDGNALAAGTHTGRIKLWRVPTGVK
jgi:WD40 repeat protein